MSECERYQARQRDDEVEEALHSLVRAALDQPKPTPALRGSLNLVLQLIAHPDRERAA